MDINEFYYKLDKLLENKEMGSIGPFLRENFEAAWNIKDHEAIIAVGNEYGGFLRDTSEYQQAIQVYETVLASMEVLGLQGSEHHGTTLLNFASTYMTMGNLTMALELYGKTTEIFKKAQLGTDYRMATLYNNMSMVCQELNDLEKAEEFLNNALFILQQLDDTQGDQAATYTNLAYLYMSQENYKEAKVSLNRAIELFNSGDMDMNPNYASAQAALAEICLVEEDYPKAIELFKMAMELVKRDYGENLNYAILCGNLAYAYGKYGDIDNQSFYNRKSEELRNSINTKG